MVLEVIVNTSVRGDNSRVTTAIGSLETESFKIWELSMTGVLILDNKDVDLLIDFNKHYIGTYTPRVNT